MHARRYLYSGAAVLLARERSLWVIATSLSLSLGFVMCLGFSTCSGVCFSPRSPFFRSLCLTCNVGKVEWMSLVQKAMDKFGPDVSAGHEKWDGTKSLSVLERVKLFSALAGFVVRKACFCCSALVGSVLLLENSLWGVSLSAPALLFAPCSSGVSSGWEKSQGVLVLSHPLSSPPIY